MGFVLKALCVLMIPTMLVSMVFSLRTDHPLADVVFAVTTVITGWGLLNVLADFAWPEDEDEDEVEDLEREDAP